MSERGYGYKYSEQQGKSTAEIAALMRRDIKHAIADGLLPGAPVKYSVRTETYSGGASIRIRVQGWADAWQPCDGYKPGEVRVAGRGRDLCRNQFCAERVKLTGDTVAGAEPHDVLGPEGQAAMMTLERIHGAYNHDGSDSMVDHFDVNYYGSVSIDTRREAEFWQGEADRKAKRRKAIDAAAVESRRRVVVYGSKGKQTVHDAVTVGGRERLVCGATLWRSSVVGSAEGKELTCTRCAKRAERDGTEAPKRPAMHTYEVTRGLPLDDSVTPAQIRMSTSDPAKVRAVIAATYRGVTHWRPAGGDSWLEVGS